MSAPPNENTLLDPLDAVVLRQRAAQLAQDTTAAPSAAAGEPVLRFTAAGQACVLELCWICEVRPAGALLAIPGAAPALLGLARLRGQLLPVLDASTLLQAPARETAGAGLLLVLGRAGANFGITISSVQGLAAMDLTAAERRGGLLESFRPELVRGVTADGSLLLDGERLLDLRDGAAWLARRSPLSATTTDST